MTQFEDEYPNAGRNIYAEYIEAKCKLQGLIYLEEQEKDRGKRKKWNRIASSHRAVPVSDRAQSTPASRHRDIHLESSSL